MKIIPVILSGGSGSRLWPLSRHAYPKQLLALTGPDTLIQQTVKRASALTDTSSPLLVCNNEHRFLIAEQLQQIDVKPLDIILEPAKRNTAPAVAAAALYCKEKEPEAVMLVLPADHLLENQVEFQKAVAQGLSLAQEGRLVTFGIRPAFPETGYGYIKKGERLSDRAFKVEKFIEKPDKKRAEEYAASSKHLWNSGMFLFRPVDYLEELKKFEPKIYEKCLEAYEHAVKDLDFLRLEKDAFEACPANSVDYAVMEGTDKAAVVSLESGWNDIGSWSSLWEVLPKRHNSNVVRGDVVFEDASDCLLFSESRLLAALGVKDLVVVETKDAVLVAHKSKSQQVKKIVRHLKEKGREEFLFHSKVYRPWGSYEGLVSGERFQVKLITVKPGARLSVQMHHHRAEHWIIVKGTAKVRRGDETMLLTENESTFIPLGTVHSLENPGKIPLELIEVQSGPYLGEDDIVRLEDMYGRVKSRAHKGHNKK